MLAPWYRTQCHTHTHTHTHSLSLSNTHSIICQVHLDTNFGITASPTAAATILSSYETWLGAGTAAGAGGALVSAAVRGVGLPSSQGVCTNHLFTHTAANGILGLAQVASASPTTVGGFCSFDMLQSTTG